MNSNNNNNNNNETLLDNDIPEKLKNTETGEVNIKAMAQSYKA